MANPTKQPRARDRGAEARYRRGRWRVGGDEGTRTPDPRDANAVLFQLSYIPTGRSSAEPAAARATVPKCSTRPVARTPPGTLPRCPIGLVTRARSPRSVGARRTSRRAFAGRRLGSLRGDARRAARRSLAHRRPRARSAGSRLPDRPDDDPDRRRARRRSWPPAPTCRSSRLSASARSSVVSPVVAAYGGLTVVLAVLVRGETLTRSRPSARCSRRSAWS